jgi:hypothetical protein
MNVGLCKCYTVLYKELGFGIYGGLGVNLSWIPRDEHVLFDNLLFSFDSML